VVRALGAALTAGGLEVRNAACRVDAGRYEFALEPRLPWSDTETTRLATRLDAELASLAAGYRAARAGNLLAALEVHRVAPRTFVKEWHDEVGAGTRPAQVKDRLFRRDEASWRRLMDHREGDHG
jgi:GH3 auxin-responsive promoter